MVSLYKGVELYLSTLATEGKSPRYIDWLNTRLRFFNDFIKDTRLVTYPIHAHHYIR
jgi:hypothetical protein